MARCVKKNISDTVNSADVYFFCVMTDGTRNQTNAEAFSITSRYTKDALVRESLLSIEEIVNLKAVASAELILQTLRKNKIK